MRRYRLAAFAAGRASDTARAGEYLSYAVAAGAATRDPRVAAPAFLAAVSLRRVADTAAAAQKRFRDRDLQQARTAVLQAQRDRIRQQQQQRTEPPRPEPPERRRDDRQRPERR
ncbi:hypothetical protein [Dactylosporangium sp. CS-033363]|uniref:hypothetical protein n=1 Tax=Dactylosporangium sp. CS-033363 TaxID=3239935 RepID=UPI003D8CB235